MRIFKFDKSLALSVNVICASKFLFYPESKFELMEESLKRHNHELEYPVYVVLF